VSDRVTTAEWRAGKLASAPMLLIERSATFDPCQWGWPVRKTAPMPSVLRVVIAVRHGSNKKAGLRRRFP
jgi:hypothetical protein